MLTFLPILPPEPGRVSWAILVCIFLTGLGCTREAVDYVDPFIGTTEGGHTFPGATVPFGMVQLSPTNDYGILRRNAGYDYRDQYIKGFAHTHLSGAGTAGLGDILLMPTVGKPEVCSGSESEPATGYRSAFSHLREKARPGYYRVRLDRYNVLAELTATERVGVHRYTFPDTSEANIIIDPTHHLQEQIYETRINLVSDREIRGFKYARGEGGDRYVFFVASFSQSFAKSEIILNDSIVAVTSDERGKNVKAFATFNALNDKPIEVKVAISYVSYRGALRNLEAEAEEKNFREVAREAEDRWSDLLNRVEVKAGAREKEIFYTSLYHAAVAPNAFSDVDGRYRLQGRVRRSDELPQYSTISSWHAFRSVHPLLNLLAPETNAAIVRSMVSRHQLADAALPGREIAGRDDGRISGVASVPVIADAVLKELPGVDEKAALQAMVQAANYDRRSHPVYPHHGLNYYTTIGYIPAQFNYSVSKALEYAYQDWCIYKAADKIGDQKTAAKFWSRSKTFVNYFNESRAFFWPKTIEGKWLDLDLNNGEALFSHYAAGNIHGYSAFMPHAVRNLEFLIGGREAFTGWLNRVFVSDGEEQKGYIGKYNHADGPSHHLPYLYVFAGQPWKTQELTRQITADFYSGRPDGLVGQDRSGQLSAWYVFNALGFYPVCPGDNKYILGSPTIDEATVHLNDSTQLLIRAEKNSGKNIFVQSVTLNGRPLNRLFLYHRELLAGGELVFKMGPKPNRALGTAEEQLPDFSAADKHHRVKGPLHFATLPPYQWRGKEIFHGNQSVRLRTNTPGATIRYTLNGRKPGPKDPLYDGKIEIEKTTRLRAVAFSDSLPPSPVFDRIYFHSVTARNRHRIRLLEAGETDARLLDRKFASGDPLDQAWFRSDGEELKVVLDLGKTEKVRSVTLHYLVHTSHGIAAPRSVRVRGGAQEDNLLLLGRQNSRWWNKTKENYVGTCSVGFRPHPCRYLELTIKNDRSGPGDFISDAKTAVMIDEIVVDAL